MNFLAQQIIVHGFPETPYKSINFSREAMQCLEERIACIISGIYVCGAG
jgi:hypothetical protein